MRTLGRTKSLYWPQRSASPAVLMGPFHLGHIEAFVGLLAATPAAITESTACVSRAVAVFIEVALAAGIPHDTAISGYLALELFVAKFSANEQISRKRSRHALCRDRRPHLT